MKTLRNTPCVSILRTRKNQLLVPLIFGMIILITASQIFLETLTECQDKPTLGAVPILSSKQFERQLAINISSLIEKNARRTDWVDDVCRRNQELMTSHAIGNIWASQRTSLAFCVVPKVGCTYWKRLLRFIESDVPYDVQYPTDIDRYTVHFIPVKKIVKYSLNSPGDPDKIKPGVNFMFSRDPYARLWSAYLDKFFLPDFWYFGRNVVQEVRQPVSEKSKVCGHDVTFEEFLRYVYLHRDDIALNEHYATVTFNCNPCKHKYDIIGKAETFKSDTDLVLANVGLLGKIEEDPNLDRVGDEISMLTDYNFDVPDALKKYSIPDYCLNNFDISHKLWKVFQYNGYIGENIPFPAHEMTVLNSRDEYKSKLKELIMDQRKLADKATLYSWKAQRTRTMQNAYNSLPDKVLKQFKEFYSIDFELFQYEKHPSWLKS